MSLCGASSAIYLPCSAAGYTDFPLIASQKPSPRGRSDHGDVPACLPRIQYSLLDVVQPDGQALCGHPHPRKSMRGLPKALLLVLDPYRSQFRSTRPFDDLLVKADIEVGLVMVILRYDNL